MIRDMERTTTHLRYIVCMYTHMYIHTYIHRTQPVKRRRMAVPCLNLNPEP